MRLPPNNRLQWRTVRCAAHLPPELTRSLALQRSCQNGMQSATVNSNSSPN